jgi:hypothetical protein
MPKDVIITPASGLLDFQGNTGISSATIQLDNNGNLNISNPGGDLTLGDTSRDIFIGDGVNNVDIIFEQNGEIRALTGKTLTLGQSDSNVTVATNLTVNGDVNSTSDVNLKDNIQTFTNALDVIENIRGVSFDWKENQKPSIGVIAQELEKVLPELVTQGDVKSVNYNGLIGVLIEAIKEQQRQIDELKNTK